ncbi:low affinity inorganic phosphate transporter 1 [Tanacetum coccineum]
MGRKRVYGMTLALMVVCSLASGLSFRHEARGVMATLCFFRFWLGIGIGDDYPLSATIMSEYSNKKTCGASFNSAVFAMQGFGILASGVVSLIVAAAFDHAFNAPSYATDAQGSTVSQASYIWRIVLMFGAISAALTYYWRMKMPETACYTALVAKNAKQAAQDSDLNTFHNNRNIIRSFKQSQNNQTTNCCFDFSPNAKFGIRNMAKMCVSFSLTAPIGIAIGYGILKTYDENSHFALIPEGVFNAVSAGKLMYMSLVDLLSVNFVKAKVQTSLKLQVLAYISLLLGVGCVSLLAIWA